MALEANRSIWTMEMQAHSSYPLLSLLRHCAPSIRDSRTACTFRTWQCKLYTYMIDVLALMSSRDLEQHDLVISIDIPRNQRTTLTNNVYISVYATSISCCKLTDAKKDKLTLPQAGQRPASFPLFAASCMLDVTSP